MQRWSEKKKFYAEIIKFLQIWKWLFSIYRVPVFILCVFESVVRVFVFLLAEANLVDEFIFILNLNFFKVSQSLTLTF